jgi:hypothetical protein
MVSNQAIKTEDLKLYYSDWLAEDVLAGWTICAEYLLNKYKCDNITIAHKKLSDGSDEAISVDVSTRGLETEKVAHSKQEKDIVEDAGIAMGLLVTQLLRPCIFIRVLKQGAGYDYYYLSEDSPDEELLEMTGTEIPNSGQERLRRKINKFRTKHPSTSGYISVSCFSDKIQIHWGHKSECNDA